MKLVSFHANSWKWKIRFSYECLVFFCGIVFCWFFKSFKILDRYIHSSTSVWRSSSESPTRVKFGVLGFANISYNSSSVNIKFDILTVKSNGKLNIVWHGHKQIATSHISDHPCWKFHLLKIQFTLCLPDTFNGNNLIRLCIRNSSMKTSKKNFCLHYVIHIVQHRIVYQKHHKRKEE